MLPRNDEQTFAQTEGRDGVISAMRITKFRYWLAKRICRRYARGYLKAVDRRGLESTLALIDEDVERHGHPFNHALARAGVIDYAEGLDDPLASESR